MFYFLLYKKKDSNGGTACECQLAGFTSTRFLGTRWAYLLTSQVSGEMFLLFSGCLPTSLILSFVRKSSAAVKGSLWKEKRIDVPWCCVWLMGDALNSCYPTVLLQTSQNISKAVNVSAGRQDLEHRGPKGVISNTHTHKKSFRKMFKIFKEDWVIKFIIMLQRFTIKLINWVS